MSARRFAAVVLLAAIGLGILAPSLIFAPHILTLIPAIAGGVPFCFALYLASPERFVAWVKVLATVRLPSIGGKQDPPAAGG